MLYEFISRVFEASGYVSVEYDFEQGERLFVPREGGQKEYFVLKAIDEFSIKGFLSDEQISLYTKLSKFFSDNESSEKNTNLILVKTYPEDLIWSQSRESYVEVNAFASLIEEDPFYFKKNLISCYEDEIRKLIQELQGTDVLSGLQRIVKDNQRYMTFCNGGDSVYGLAASVFSKLPFLSFSVEGEYLVDLQDTIDKEVSIKGLTGIRDQLLGLSLDDEDLLGKLIGYSQGGSDV